MKEEEYRLVKSKDPFEKAQHLQEIVPNGSKLKHNLPIDGTQVDKTKIAMLEN